MLALGKCAFSLGMDQETHKEVNQLLDQADANEVCACLMSPARAKKLNRVAKQMRKEAFRLAGPVDPEIKAMNDTELLKELGL